MLSPCRSVTYVSVTFVSVVTLSFCDIHVCSHPAVISHTPPSYLLVFSQCRSFTYTSVIIVNVFTLQFSSHVSSVTFHLLSSVLRYSSFFCAVCQKISDVSSPSFLDVSAICPSQLYTGFTSVRRFVLASCTLGSPQYDDLS